MSEKDHLVLSFFCKEGIWDGYLYENFEQAREASQNIHGAELKLRCSLPFEKKQSLQFFVVYQQGAFISSLPAAFLTRNDALNALVEGRKLDALVSVWLIVVRHGHVEQVQAQQLLH